MKPVINESKVFLRKRFSSYTSILGLLGLLGAVLLPYFFKQPEIPVIASTLFIIGLFSSMVGIFFANRWVRKPRPETVLDEELKNLPDHFRMYHYQHKAGDHILLTPSGVIVLECVSIEGRFVYRKQRWHEYMKLGRAMRYIVEEHLGDPSRAAISSRDYLQAAFSRDLDGGSQVPVSAMVVFTHPRCAIELVENPPVPAMKAVNLRKNVGAKATRMPPALYQAVQAYLDR